MRYITSVATLFLFSCALVSFSSTYGMKEEKSTLKNEKKVTNTIHSAYGKAAAVSSALATFLGVGTLYYAYTHPENSKASKCGWSLTLIGATSSIYCFNKWWNGNNNKTNTNINQG